MAPAEGILLIACLTAGAGFGGWILYRRPRQQNTSPPSEREAVVHALKDLLLEALPLESPEVTASVEMPSSQMSVSSSSHTVADPDAVSLLDLALGQQGFSRDSVRVAVLEERLRSIERELGLLRSEQIGEGKIVAVVLYVLASVAAIAVVVFELMRGP